MHRNTRIFQISMIRVTPKVNMTLDNVTITWNNYHHTCSLTHLPKSVRCTTFGMEIYLEKHLHSVTTSVNKKRNKRTLRESEKQLPLCDKENIKVRVTNDIVEIQLLPDVNISRIIFGKFLNNLLQDSLLFKVTDF